MLIKIWNIINEASNTCATKANNITSIVEGNTLKETSREIASVMNKYFNQIGKDFANKITCNKTKFQETVIRDSMFLTAVSDEEILSIINNLKNNTAPGLDNISTKVIKENKISIVTPLKHIINLSFANGIVPTAFKESVIIPIYKDGDKTQPSNYRPISLLSNFAKIFEKCLRKRLLSYFDKNKVIDKFQYGFKEGISTTDAIFKLTNHLYNNLENNKKTIAIFLDLAKAFDTVSHKILLRKLENVGIRGIVLDLFKSYLTNRLQRVKINNDFSHPETVAYGIPQGTVLGPILFLLYINDIAKVNIDGKLIAYADDTALVFESNSWEDTQQKAERGLSKIKMWLDNNLLTLNENKTYFLYFALHKNSLPNIKKLTIHNSNCLNKSLPINDCTCNTYIKNCDSIKYLGVVLDSSLKWDKQITQLCSKIRKLIYKFIQLRDILSNKLLKILYYTLVESILRYGIIFWGAAYNNVLSLIEVTQKTIIKVIYKKNKLYPTFELFKESGFLDIRQLFLLSTVVYLYRKPELRTQLNYERDTRTKSSNNLAVPLRCKTKTQNSFAYLAPKFYNLIPINIKNSTTLNTFNKKIKEWLIKNPSIYKNVTQQIQ